MSNNLSRIREALRRNNIVLSNGELRIDEPPPHRPLATRRGPAPVGSPAAPPLESPQPEAVFTEAPPAVRLKPTTWAAAGAWYEQANYARRFEGECSAVLKQMPDAVLGVTERGELFWQMKVKSLGGAHYDISVLYPSNFPFGELQAYVLNPKLDYSPHQYADGGLCLGHSFGKATSALTTAAWSAAWLSAYEVYKQTGIWPEFQ